MLRHPWTILILALSTSCALLGCELQDSASEGRVGDAIGGVDVGNSCHGIPIDDPDHKCNTTESNLSDVGLSDFGIVRDCFDKIGEDEDGDGIPNELEDVDLDCRRDLDETDWRNADSDGDGLDDGEEDRNLNGTLDPGESDPRNSDTDGDGVPDGRDRHPDAEQPRDHCLRDKSRCLPNPKDSQP